MGMKKLAALVMALMLCMVAVGAMAATTGTVTPAYTTGGDGTLSVWGEGRADADQSFVLKLYADNTLIATSKLNNIDGIIDGDVYVTWSFNYPSKKGGYWTTTWEKGQPLADVQPTKVVLYADGEKVAENEVQMNAPDNLKHVDWKELVDQLIRVEEDPDTDFNSANFNSADFPKTGDNSSLLLWLALMAAGAVGFVMVRKNRAYD